MALLGYAFWRFRNIHAHASIRNCGAPTALFTINGRTICNCDTAIAEIYNRGCHRHTFRTDDFPGQSVLELAQGAGGKKESVGMHYAGMVRAFSGNRQGAAGKSWAVRVQRSWSGARLCDARRPSHLKQQPAIRVVYADYWRPCRDRAQA